MSAIRQKTKGKQGFASMTREKQREITSKGGRASQAKGTGHQWTPEEAREAGCRGGTISRGGRGKLSKLAEKAALTFMLLLACGSAQANGINLVANGDFTLGNTGFSTDYVAKQAGTNDMWDPGTYTVDTSAAGNHAVSHEPVPEPMTLVMLSAGLMLAAKWMQRLGVA